MSGFNMPPGVGVHDIPGNEAPRRKRDLTKEQFEHRARKLGFEGPTLMGYWSLPADSATHVSVWNAGKRRRDQLRYLVAQNKRVLDRLNNDRSQTGLKSAALSQ